MAEHASPELNIQEPPVIVSVEDIIEGSIARMNFMQFIQAVLASVAPFFDSQQTFISVFTDAQPAWHCTDHNICRPSSDICSLPKNAWAWNGNVHSTIISEWHLECSSTSITGLPATFFFLGCLLGGFALPPLGDSSLGRKNLVFISCLIMLLSALASAFSANIWMYSAFRFISGIGRTSITISSFVLMSERVGKQWRGQVVLLGFASLNFGLLSLTGIAYLFQNSSWRTLYLWTSVPGVVCCLVSHFFLCESPRWLLMRGLDKDAAAVLKLIGSVDFVSLPKMLLRQELPKNRNPYLSLKILVKRGWAVQRLLACMVLSFGVGLGYYGMLLGVGDFGFNVYLITTVNALLSLLSSLLTYLFWIPKCNRRSSVLAFCTISGAASIVSIAARHHHKGIVIGLEFVTLFSASMVFNLLFMYVVEMFPTCVRNSAAALSRQALLLASIFVPILVVIGRRNELLFHAVFGSGILLSGLFVLSLPETWGKPLCDTIEEQEVRDGAAGCLSIF